VCERQQASPFSEGLWSPTQGHFSKKWQAVVILIAIQVYVLEGHGKPSIQCSSEFTARSSNSGLAGRLAKMPIGLRTLIEKGGESVSTRNLFRYAFAV